MQEIMGENKRFLSGVVEGEQILVANVRHSVMEGGSVEL